MNLEHPREEHSLPKDPDTGPLLAIECPLERIIKPLDMEHSSVQSRLVRQPTPVNVHPMSTHALVLKAVFSRQPLRLSPLEISQVEFDEDIAAAKLTPPRPTSLGG